MTNRETELRKEAYELKLKSLEKQDEWAREVLTTFGGPGGSGRYSTKEDAKEARRLYLKAHSIIWRKTAKGKQSSKNNDSSQYKKETRSLRLKRTPAISKFYIDMLEAKIIKCHYCKRNIEKHERQADHFMPLSKGGEHRVSNLVVCCYICNARKGDMLPITFMGLISKGSNS